MRMLSEIETLVIDLQRAARKERGKGKRALLYRAAETLWAEVNRGEDERTPMPCPQCGSHSTDCGCD